MLERRRRATGVAALSLTAVGAVLGMEGSAFPTIKEPRSAAMGGGWVNDQVHFALQARSDPAGDFGHLNIRLADNLGAFWGDVTSLEIISPEHASIQGVVRKATGAYAACEGQPFSATAQDGDDTKEGDGLQAGCDGGGPRFAGAVERGNLEVDSGIIAPD